MSTLKDIIAYACNGESYAKYNFCAKIRLVYCLVLKSQNSLMK